MLAVNRYNRAHIDGCRARIDAQVAAFRDVAKAVTGTKSGDVIEAFEPRFFNGLLLLLDYSFVHRIRNMEGKNGNPINEVRVLCNSLMGGGGVLVADKGIKLDPSRSILGLAAGDPIALSGDDFARLSDAFFAEIERVYG